MNQINSTGADAVAGLITDEELAIHLENCLRATGPGLLGTLGHMARFQGDSPPPAKRSRPISLFRMLLSKPEPKFSDVFTVTCAMGFRMHFEAMSTLRDRASDHR